MQETVEVSSQRQLSFDLNGGKQAKSLPHFHACLRTSRQTPYIYIDDLTLFRSTSPEKLCRASTQETVSTGAVHAGI